VAFGQCPGWGTVLRGFDWGVDVSWLSFAFTGHLASAPDCFLQKAQDINHFRPHLKNPSAFSNRRFHPIFTPAPTGNLFAFFVILLFIQIRVKKYLFVTGTDTGAGKTVLTAMLLAFLRRGGGRALAMKPFCSGSRGDARLLHRLQRECVTLDDVNPFHFDRPLAPAAAAGRGRPGVSRQAALGQIRLLASRCDLLVVEGVGGLMTPLGEGYTMRDLIRRLHGKTIIVCPNRLGAINHVVLTAEALQSAGIKEFTVVMRGVRKPDISAASNARMIRQMLPLIPVFCLPYLGFRASTARAAKENAKYLKKTLAHVVGCDIVRMFFHRKKRVG
jgi:dethiobiotin synthetase